MTKRFDTEPDDLSNEIEIESITSRQLQQKVSILEERLRRLETKISATLNDPAFKNRIDTDSTAWQKNENALGRIAGTLKSIEMDKLKVSPDLKARLDDDVK